MSDASSAAPESSSAASSSGASSGASSAGGDAAAAGGGHTMLIVGGLVALLAVGGAGLFLALSGKSTAATTTGPKGDNTGGNGNTGGKTGGGTGNGTSNGNGTKPQPHGHNNTDGHNSTNPHPNNTVPITPPDGYHGVPLGAFQDAVHDVEGYVYVADENTLHLMEFSFDGDAPSTFFFASKTSARDDKGVKLKDEKGNDKELGKYTKQDIMITLNDGDKVEEFQFFYVFCASAQAVFGWVPMNATTVPKQMKLEESDVESPDNMVGITSVTLVDTITMKLQGITVSPNLTEYVIKAGKSEPLEDSSAAIELTPSTIPPGQAEVELKLPDDNSWTDLKWVAFFDSTTKKVAATINLPDPKEMLIPVHHKSKAKSRRRRAKGRRTAGMSAVKAAPSKPKLLVCSYGESGVVKTMVPSDGLCDVIFYTDVTYDNDAEAIVSRDGGPAFDVLKSAAKQYTRTSFGTSMATGAIADTVKEKKSELMAAMGDIFAAKLTHFGMLNVENIEDYDKLKDADLQYITVADEFLQGKPSSLTRHRALGFSLRDGSKGPKILEAAKQVSSDFPELTMVIIKLHTENYGPTGDHWPLAPNPDDVDLSEHNALSLAAIKEDLEEPLQEISKQGKYAMLSFAMFARTYRMKHTWSGAAAREMSESSLNMDYSSVCKMKTEKDSEDTGTLYATDEHKKFLALFDSENTFRTKTNNRLNVMPQKFTGLAVYNVEMDDHKGICGKGKFVRLKAIKAALAA
uniref:Chitin-binding protein n=1 Tax=Rhipicephalus appendiculatus TaxID=34631 RepID=A0A131YQ13_RHIAP